MPSWMWFFPAGHLPMAYDSLWEIHESDSA